jgi:hypothetical protein
MMEHMDDAAGAKRVGRLPNGKYRWQTRYYAKACAICGTEFQCPSRAPVKTCSSECARECRLRSLRETVGAEQDRFWRYVEKTDSCWLWIGGLHSGGYGIFSNSNGGYAHRFSWELHNGRKLSSTEFVCHRCDNPRCVNPSHLFAGTPADNSADCRAKGRQCRGEAKASAKLTAADVLNLRSDAANGERVVDLARRYGVSPHHAAAIVLRRFWRHI